MANLDLAFESLLAAWRPGRDAGVVVLAGDATSRRARNLTHVSQPIRQTTDPDGRDVVFDEGTRLHLALGRPDLLEHIDAIMSVQDNPPKGWRE